MTIPSFSSMPDPPSPLEALLQTEAAREPVRYTGDLQPDPAYYDGRLPHAIGVHHIQVFRASRSTAHGGVGFTYNHQPFLVWWRGTYYLQYLGARRNEHDAPTLTFLCSSADGYTWSAPAIVFPEYRLPAFSLDGKTYPAGLSAVMHQRMGFYSAPNGRLLTIGFYGICPDPEHSPNAGQGVGRVVREIRDDGSFGPIHFIRYNRHCGFDERNTAYPFYAASTDAGFRAACDALLADKLATLQWWEEDRARDGFFPIDPAAVPGAPEFHAGTVTSAGAGKAFTWFTRLDGVVVGLWKNQYSALTPDRGRSWTPIVRNKTLRTTGAKIWGQRTSDHRFVLVYNHSATRVNRFPISALVGDDGAEYSTLLCLGGEVPPRRFAGGHKGAGMHYFRGISEGSPQPPDGDVWVAYSVNKEDIWVLRARVPLTAEQLTPVLADEIAQATTIAELRRWSFHLPQWATARIVIDEQTNRRALELRDEDRWDHAQAERVFPIARSVRVRFRVHCRELAADGCLEIDVQSQRHHRPVQLRIERDLLFVAGALSPLPFPRGQWRAFQLDCDGGAGNFAVRIDGVTVLAGVPFAESTRTVERIVFRTGAWRGRVPEHLVDGTVAREERSAGEDLPDNGRVSATVFWIDDFTTDGA